MRNSKQPRVKVLSSKTVYRGPVFEVTSDQVQEPGGVKARRDVVRHQGSVVVMAIDESRREPRVLLARQFRYAAREYLWELPAGRIDPGEDAIAGARRELEEETGYSAENWKQVLFFYSSPGFLDESMTLYLARGLKKGRARPEDDEVISKRLFSLSAAIRMVMRGAIHDGKTIAGLLWLNQAWLQGGLSGRKR